ncbi:MAG: Hsp20/alpha crystallin family protein [Desulfobacterales bacterium]|nr:Hsp20/alpha crystallin family protein [Desulfobacterales bacterium]
MLTTRFFNIPTQSFKSPFDELNRMRRFLDHLTQGSAYSSPFRSLSQSGVFPSINMTEDVDNYFIRAELPGIKAGNLDIQVEGKVLKLSGERKFSEEDENVQYHRREREAGTFSRAFTLPGDVNVDKVDAKMSNGILTITVPKAEAAKPKQITIS